MDAWRTLPTFAFKRRAQMPALRIAPDHSDVRHSANPHGTAGGIDLKGQPNLLLPTLPTWLVIERGQRDTEKPDAALGGQHPGKQRVDEA